MIAAVVTRDIAVQATSHEIMQDSPKSLRDFLIEAEAFLGIFQGSLSLLKFGGDSNMKVLRRNNCSDALRIDGHSGEVEA